MQANIDKIKAAIKTVHRGSYVVVEYRTQLQALDGSILWKQTRCVTRLGVEYEHIWSVAASGKAPGQLKGFKRWLDGLKWFVYEDSNGLKLRLTRAPNVQRQITYVDSGYTSFTKNELINAKIVNAEDVQGHPVLLVQCVKLENVISINGIYVR